jgi:hypothetical protein
MKSDDAPVGSVPRQPRDNFPPSRRQFARMLVDLPATFALGERPDWENCSIVNIGGGGLRLQTRYKIAGGVSNVTIRFDFEGVPVVAQARVVDSMFDRSRDGFFSSAAFTSIDPVQRQRIAERVDELRAAGQKATPS